MHCGVLVLIISVLFVQNCVVGWIGYIEHNPKDVIPEGAHCFTDHKNVGALNENEEKRLPDECAIAECQENHNVVLRGCAPVLARPPCYIYPGDLSKPYPECCYELKCLGDAKDFEKNMIDDIA